MVDFFEETFNYKIFSSLLFLGIFLCAILTPLSFFLHSFGHGIFGAISGSKFIGIYIPLDDHSNAVLNYPNTFFSGSKSSLLYWFGGHIFIFFLLLIVLFFPTGSSLVEMIIIETSGYYIAFFGGFVQAVLAFGSEETTSIPEILKINPYYFLFFISIIYIIFSFYFLYRLISFFGKSFKESLLVPIFLSFSLWYFPFFLYLVFIFLIKGFVLKIHFPVYLIGTIFLLLSPLIPRGKKVWERPKFAKTIYGLLLLSVFTVLIFYFLFYNKEFPILLWGEVGPFCNLPLEVKI